MVEAMPHPGPPAGSLDEAANPDGRKALSEMELKMPTI
jgi:hypothetical protein